jgi:hypothetical protein
MAPRARVFTIGNAREKISEKLRKAAGKGAATFVTASAAPEKRAVFDQAVGEMISEKRVVLNSSTAKPKYYLPEFAPSPSKAAEKIEQFAAIQHPLVLALAGFKKALAADEKPFLAEAIQSLEAEKRLLQLRCGRSLVFAHADSLRAMLGISAGSGPARSVDPATMREAYLALVRRTGFPDVEISALQRETGIDMAALKAWLLAEREQGRANLYLGDWSLADERKRAGAIELRGERYLLVRLEE